LIAALPRCAVSRVANPAAAPPAKRRPVAIHTRADWQPAKQQTRLSALQPRCTLSWRKTAQSTKRRFMERALGNCAAAPDVCLLRSAAHNWGRAGERGGFITPTPIRPARPGNQLPSAAERIGKRFEPFRLPCIPHFATGPRPVLWLRTKAVSSCQHPAKRTSCEKA
jgi:hypothetical protein